jgi:GNAT superfamily N-acetyltransferase
MSLAIVPFEPAHLHEAARLLADAHRLNRERQLLLPAAYEDPRAARELIENALTHPHAGVAALRRDRLAGYLIGRISVDFMERRATVWPEGAAIASAEDPELYREMYASAAEHWVRNGSFLHQVFLAATDAVAIQAWFSLGFGRFSTYNWREIEPIAGPEAEIVVRRVGPEALDDEEALRNGLRRYNASSPIFHPLIWRLGGEQKQTLAVERAGMASERNAYFIAYQDGRPVGLVIFTPPFPGYMLTPDDAAYLHIAYVDEKARAGGVGAALVNRGLGWAREQGYKLCTLSYYPPNLLGAHYWQSKGFKPLSFCLERRIDERIAWAKGDV